jgi:diacylglycerol kinase family enzyme
MYADGKFYGKIRRTAYANRATRVSVVDGKLIEIRSAEHIRSKAVTLKCHHRKDMPANSGGYWYRKKPKKKPTRKGALRSDAPTE